MEVSTAMSRLPPNPALKELETLIGEWEVEVPESPDSAGERLSNGSKVVPICASTY